MESMSETVRYSERRSAVVPAIVWRRSGPASRTEILPDGCMDLIWTGSALMIAGPDTGPVTVDGQHSADMTALRFDPGIAPVVFDCPATEMINGRFALDDVWPARTARLLTDEVAASDDPAAVLQRCAADRLGTRPPPRWLGPATALLAAGWPVGKVSDTISASPRQLQRWSHHHYGYGAKTLQRILRVNDALARLRTGTPLSDVATSCGYADYPHMFREFRAVTHRTPAELLPSHAA
jgi:AraC-like DNA-binding protein